MKLVAVWSVLFTILEIFSHIYVGLLNERLATCILLLLCAALTCAGTMTTAMIAGCSDDGRRRDFLVAVVA